ncbi:MAG TPA: pyridoxal phosphate-dependent aminotransferase [Clostridiaceae bacterium]|nr:pyridoxal phosphate-dependent aminotransferase [Clostridiaceae bacterium]
MISEKMKKSVSGSSVIRAMFEEGTKLSKIYGAENVFDFSIGNPNVEPPASIKKAIIDIVSEENPNMVHGYMNNSGYEDVREAIAQNINKKHGLDLTFKNIVMTVGAAGGLNIIFKTILNPDDEVITFSPFFGEYRGYVDSFAGKLVIVPTQYGTFMPDLAALEAAITPKTKAVIINNPNNPTGVVYKEDVIKGIADLLTRKSEQLGTCIYIVSDEPYRELVYDEHIKVPYMLKYYKNAFIGYSYSKSLSLPGERIGYVAFSNEMEDIEDVAQGLGIATRILGYVNAPSLMQRVIARCLDSEVDVSIYKKNRDLLYNHLTSLGFECAKPEGAFYLFVKALIPDDSAFAAAAKKYNLLIVPGSAFGGPGYFRIAYCTSFDKIEKSLGAWTKLAEEFKK